MQLTQWIGLSTGSVVAVIGCGGKTSVVDLLAYENRSTSVLLTPTTKIKMPVQPWVTYTPDSRQNLSRPKVGVTCMGELGPNGKLSALPLHRLAALYPAFALTLCEADGSRGLPCKGWAAYEPVIPPFATHTVGLVTLGGLGLPATEATVHRLPMFLALTGLHQGDIITMQALADMVAAPQGMFAKAVGKQIVLLNQINTPAQQPSAEQFLNVVGSRWPKQARRFLFGSVQGQTFTEYVPFAK